MVELKPRKSDYMEKIRLIADSAANMLNDPARNFVSVPLTITFAGQDFIDNDHLAIAPLLEAMEKNSEKASTACPSIQEWLDALDGSQQAVIVTITSGLSGSYDSAKQAVAIYQERHPEAEVLVLDSLSAGPELRLLVEELERLVQNGTQFAELEAKIKAYQSQTHLLFALQSLHNLAVNGRVNSLVAKAAGLLKIRLIGEASTEGKLADLAKARGSKKTVREIYEQMKKAGYQGGKVQIDHVRNEKDARSLEQLILADFPAAEINFGFCRGLCTFYAEDGGIMVGYHN